jgi:hypothetical protein
VDELNIVLFVPDREMALLSGMWCKCEWYDIPKLEVGCS